MTEPNLPYTYRVRFTHENTNAPEDNPNKHGIGELEFKSEHPVLTNQDTYDVARWIGHTYGFTSVGISRIDDISDNDDVPEAQSITSLPPA